MTSHRETSGQAARERDRLRVSVELAIPKLVKSRQLLAAINNSSEADELLQPRSTSSASECTDVPEHQAQRTVIPPRADHGPVRSSSKPPRFASGIEFSGATRHVWWPITEIDDKPRDPRHHLRHRARRPPSHPGPQDNAGRPRTPGERAMTPTETETQQAVAAGSEPSPSERRRAARAPSPGQPPTCRLSR